MQSERASRRAEKFFLHTSEDRESCSCVCTHALLWFSELVALLVATPADAVSVAL